MFEALLRGCVSLLNLVKIFLAPRREESRFVGQDEEDEQDEYKYDSGNVLLEFSFILIILTKDFGFFKTCNTENF